MIRILLGLAMLAVAVMPRTASAADRPHVTLYKNPSCTCCEDYAAYLRENGYKVTVKRTNDLSLITKAKGVPDSLDGCHLSEIGGYVVEGHVPVNVIARLLGERPDIGGISLPGMPLGTPGMAGRKEGPFTIYAFSKGAPNKVYAVE